STWIFRLRFAMGPFAELCAKTNFSFLEGASRPEEMVQSAKDRGLFALAIADRNGFYGSVRAHEEAKKRPQRYIVGAELAVSPDRRTKGPTSKVVFLVESHAGYRNLCRLITSAHVDLPREEANLSLSSLPSNCDGLFLM